MSTKKTFHPSLARPRIGQDAAEIQPFGTIVKLPNGLSEAVCKESVERLNQILADTMTLRDLYKKHHWQVVGKTFYQLHLLFDKHYEEQAELVDQIAERIQLLGGLSYAMAADVAENTNIHVHQRAAKKCRSRSRGCLPRMKSFSRAHGPRRAKPRRWAMTAPMTC